MALGPRLVRAAQLLAAWLAVAHALGCRDPGGDGPRVEAIADQIVAVGREVRLAIVPIAAAGEVSYRLASPSAGVAGRAGIDVVAAGSGLFRWTPLVADLGIHDVTVYVGDDAGTTAVSFRLDVRAVVGDARLPRFLEPVGAGAVLDLTQQPCLTVPVIVDDQDTVEVALVQEPPLIEGAQLDRVGPQAARWSWCPSAGQAAAPGRYSLLLSADDGENPKALKAFELILRNSDNAECPGLAPVVVDASNDVTTLAPLRLEVLVEDDHHLQYPPLLYVAANDSATPPPASQFQVVLMSLVETAGLTTAWAALLPNPTAGLAAGATRYVHYAIEVQDDDDATGACDHLTRMPSFGWNQIEVTSPGGVVDGAMCSPCSTDSQCGAGDLCAMVGVFGRSYCLAACAGNEACPVGTVCSTDEVSSLDGAIARQCVPEVGSCIATVACDDDALEDNDTRLASLGMPALPMGVIELMMCPALTENAYADEDWLALTLANASLVTLETVAEDGGDDLTLALFGPSGALIASSAAAGENGEAIAACLPAGSYSVRVSALAAMHATAYLLSFEAAGASCATEPP